MYQPTLHITERNGPGGIKTDSLSPMITSGVATPKHASNNIMAVIATAATTPASKPAAIPFARLIDVDPTSYAPRGNQIRRSRDTLTLRPFSWWYVSD